MTNAMTHALRDAGLISEPATSLPPKAQRKKAADRMWLMAAGLPTPEQQRKTQRIIEAASARSSKYQWDAYDSAGAAVVWQWLNRGYDMARITWPNEMQEDFDLMSDTDCAILRDAIDEDPSLHDRVVGRRRTERRI